MAVNLSPVGGVAAQFLDNSGNVLTGGKLYTYLAGTTTPAVTYTSNSGFVANSNPIILNAAGRVADSGEIWLTDGISYKFVLKDSNDVQIATWDNIIGINSNFINYSLQEQTFTATQGQTVFTLTGGKQYTPATNNLAIYVNGSKQVAGTNYLETSTTVFTFLTGLNVGDVVDAITAISVATNVINSVNVSYNQGGTGAVTTNVQAKLRESVSVKDFGAIGDGTTNDTTAIQNAINYAGTVNGATVYFPTGTYKVTSTLTMRDYVTLKGDSGLYPGSSKIVSTASNIFYGIGNGSGTGYSIFNLLNMSIQGSRNGTQNFLSRTGTTSWAFSLVESCYLVNITLFDLLLTGVHFSNNNFQNQVKITLRGADCNFDSNYFGYDNADTTALTTDPFVDVVSSGAFVFTGNYISSYSPSRGVAPIPLQIEGALDCFLSQNRIDGGTTRSLSFVSGSQRIIMMSNRITSITSGIPIYFSNVTQITFSNNIIEGLTASQAFATCNSTEVDIILRDNQTNSRTDSTTHDFVDNSAGTSFITLTSPDLTSLNITSNLNFSSAYFGRVITNTGGTGVQYIYIQSSNFLPTNTFYFKNTGARLIVYDSTTSAAIYDSLTSGYTTGKVVCYVSGTVVASSV